MNKTDSAQKQRYYLFDNLKFFLILLVVVGHFADGYLYELYDRTKIIAGKPETLMYNKVTIFLYAFHMPLFLFLSGLFQKRDCNKSVLKKALSFFILGYILKCFLYISKCVFRTPYNADSKISFSLLGGDGPFWYLLALAVFIVLTYILKDVKPSLVMGFFIMLSLCVGYDNSVGDMLVLSRIIVFFPFYYAGVCLSPQKIIDLCSKTFVKIISWIVVAVWAYLSFAQVELVYPLRSLFTGRHSYQHVEKLTQMECSFVNRLVAMAIAGVLCFAFLGISVNAYIPFISKAGTQTLSVYFWHRTVLYVITHFAVAEKLEEHFPDYWWIFYLLIAAAVTCILSLNIFAKPINAILGAINNQKQETYKRTIVFAAAYLASALILKGFFTNNWWLYSLVPAMAVTCLCSMKIFGKFRNAISGVIMTRKEK